MYDGTEQLPIESGGRSHHLCEGFHKREGNIIRNKRGSVVNVSLSYLILWLLGRNRSWEEVGGNNPRGSVCIDPK